MICAVLCLERETERRAQCATEEVEGEAETVGVACDVVAEVSDDSTVGEVASIVPGSVVSGSPADVGEQVGVSRRMVARMAQELVEDGVLRQSRWERTWSVGPVKGR